MKCTIHQPNYLYWLGFFDKISKVDICILYDTSQYVKNTIANRNKIRTKDGWMYLTVPVAFSLGQNFNEVKIDKTQTLINKHWASIVANYSKAPFFEKYRETFEEIYSKDWNYLTDFNIELLKKITDILGIKVKFVLASELGEITSKGTDALIELCKKVKADTYYSGTDGNIYLDKKRFQEKGIKLEFQNYKHPTYLQAHPGFEPNMCILDLIFNHGPNSLKILKN